MVPERSVVTTKLPTEVVAVDTPSPESFVVLREARAPTLGPFILPVPGNDTWRPEWEPHFFRCSGGDPWVDAGLPLSRRAIPVLGAGARAHALDSPRLW